MFGLEPSKRGRLFRNESVAVPTPRLVFKLSQNHPAGILNIHAHLTKIIINSILEGSNVGAMVTAMNGGRL